MDRENVDICIIEKPCFNFCIHPTILPDSVSNAKATWILFLYIATWIGDEEVDEKKDLSELRKQKVFFTALKHFLQPNMLAETFHKPNS